MVNFQMMNQDKRLQDTRNIKVNVIKILMVLQVKNKI